METLGALLKGLRERAAVSQEAVSARAQLSETYYGKIEGNKRRPDALTLLRVLAVLDASQAEELQAIRLFMSAREPAVFLTKLQAALLIRPPLGTVTPVAAPSRKRRRRLGLVLLVSGFYLAGAPGMIAMASARPITCADDQRDSVAWRRRRAA